MKRARYRSKACGPQLRNNRGNGSQRIPVQACAQARPEQHGSSGDGAADLVTLEAEAAQCAGGGSRAERPPRCWRCHSAEPGEPGRHAERMRQAQILPPARASCAPQVLPCRRAVLLCRCGALGLLTCRSGVLVAQSPARRSRQFCSHHPWQAATIAGHVEAWNFLRIVVRTFPRGPVVRSVWQGPDPCGPGGHVAGGRARMWPLLR